MTTLEAPPSSLTDRYGLAIVGRLAGRVDLLALAARAAADPSLRAALGTRLLLRPMFLAATERDALERDLATLQRLLLSLPHRLYGGDVTAMCTGLGFSPTQVMAVEETWQDADVLLSRADLLRGADGFRAVEFNLHSSLGGIDSGPWYQAFLDLPTFAEFAAAERLTFVNPVDGVAGVIRAAARARGLGSFPAVAIVDWPTSYPLLRPRLDRLAGLLRQRGFDAFSCSAAQLRFRGGRLHARNRRIDVLYRVFLLEDLPRDPVLLAPVLAAHRAGTLVLAMSFLAELVGNKGCLAMLWDPAFADSFTAEERAVIARTVPPTRWVRSCPSLSAGSAELAEFADSAREELVLKPAGGYAARGVVAGWSTEPERWRAAVAAVRDKPWVLQERVRGVPETVPVVEEGAEDALVVQTVDVNWGVFLAGERFNGAMIRAVPVTATQQLITTSTGASVGACFMKRE